MKVNLGDDDQTPKPLKQTRANSLLMTGNITGDGDIKDANGDANLQPSAFVEIAAGNTANKTDAQNASKSKMKTGAQLTRLVNKKLAEAIKFRPIKPRSPYLNGKVECSQRTDLEEFYSTVDLQDTKLQQKLRDWQDYYNEFRPHGSLGSKTPWEKWTELVMKTPYQDEVEAAVDESKERLRLQNYKDDLYWQNLKLSL